MVQPFDFTGQTAVVTGGAGILGGEMAYALVKHGATEIGGDNASCESSDQRGKSRPFDGDNTPPTVCDIGSVELNTIALIAISKTPTSQAIDPGETVTFIIEIENVGGVGLQNIVVTDGLVPACDFTVTTLTTGATESKTCAKSNVTAGFTNIASVEATVQGSPGTKVNNSAEAVITVNQTNLYLPLVIK